MINLSQYAAKPGDLPRSVGRPWAYFEERGCVLDTRGPLRIAASSRWGLGVKVITRSHDVHDWPTVGETIDRGVQVDEGVWIGSFCVLMGCHIGAHSIVAAGTVVRCQDVAPWVMVAGNPARVIARWDGTQWAYLPEDVTQFTRSLE